MVVYPEIKEVLESGLSGTHEAYDRQRRTVGSHIKEFAKSLCTVSTLKKRLPIYEWLPKYKLVFLVQDMLAGITVGLTAVPQGIAYAVVAGLEPQYGLYGGFMGCFMYLLFGSCKDVTIGPTAILSLMVQKYASGYNADYAVLITFLSGLIILVLGVLHLGFLVQFISIPVTVGFTSGAAIIILSSQLKSLFGLAGSSNSFIEAIENLIANIHTIKLWDSVLGISTIVLLLLLKHLGKYGSKTSTPEYSTFKNMLRKLNWITSLSRNAIVVILGILIAWIFKTTKGTEPFTLTGNIKEGLPDFGPPPFSTVVGNETHTFTRIVSELGTSLITLPLISILESIAISKAFSLGKVVDATQEMIALGLCNIAGSFVRSMPTTGSFTRTAVNHASGVQTQAGGIFTGCLVLFALGLLTKTFYFIPKAVLAGLIICAMIFMVEYHMAITLWRTRKLELAIMILTFLACLVFGLEIGICVGVSLDALILLLKISRPSFTSRYCKVGEKEVLLVTIPRSLNYCAADHLIMHVLSEVSVYPEAALIIDGANMRNIDTTVAKSFKSLIDDMTARSQLIILWQFTPQSRNIFVKTVPSMESVLSNEPTIEEALNSIASPHPVTPEN